MFILLILLNFILHNSASEDLTKLCQDSVTCANLRICCKSVCQTNELGDAVTICRTLRWKPLDWTKTFCLCGRDQRSNGSPPNLRRTVQTSTVQSIITKYTTPKYIDKSKSQRNFVVSRTQEIQVQGEGSNHTSAQRTLIPHSNRVQGEGSNHTSAQRTLIPHSNLENEVASVNRTQVNTNNKISEEDYFEISKLQTNPNPEDFKAMKSLETATSTQLFISMETPLVIVPQIKQRKSEDYFYEDVERKEYFNSGYEDNLVYTEAAPLYNTYTNHEAKTQPKAENYKNKQNKLSITNLHYFIALLISLFYCY